MTLTYLIDGYNLLHFMGTLSGPTGPTGLEKARLGLLGMLKHAFAEGSEECLVVFDAQNAPPGVPNQTFEYPITVRFATGHDEADDLIEELVRKHSVPKKLVVVSDDHRLRQAATRRHASAMSCEQFLELVESRRHPPPPRHASPEKPNQLSAKETQQLLDAFADVDPDLRKLADPFDFEGITE